MKQLRSLDKLTPAEQNELKEAMQTKEPDIIKMFMTAATGHKDERVVELMLRAGMDIKSLGDLCISLIVDYGTTNIVKMLIEAGVDVTGENWYLESAIIDNDFEKFELLLESGSKISDRCLRMAIANGNTKMVERLIQKGERLSEKWPLEYVMAENEFQILDRIVKNLTIRNNNNKWKTKMANLLKELLKKLLK